MNEKFYLIEVAYGDSKIEGKGIYEYNDKQKALAQYHKKLGTALDSDLYTEELIMVVDEHNAVWASDRKGEVTTPKYYLIEIATGDAKITGKKMYEYTSRKEAIANYHSKLGTAIKSALYATEQIFVVNSYGYIEMREKYIASAME